MTNQPAAGSQNLFIFFHNHNGTQHIPETMLIPSWIGWNLLRKDQFPNLMHAGQHHLVLHLFHLLQRNIFYQSMWKLFTFPSYSKCIASEGFPFDIFDIFDSWFVALLFSVICSLTLMLPSCCKLQNNLQLYHLLLCIQNMSFHMFIYFPTHITHHIQICTFTITECV